MTVSTPTVIYEKQDRVAYITLNRPEVLNALNREIMRGIHDAILDFRDDPDLLVAIVTGNGGRAFSSGVDLKEQARQDAGGGSSSSFPAIDGGSFIDMGVFKPIVAAIDGYCVAGGLELALECDIRVATAQSQFGLPEPRWSLTASYGLHHLSRMVPLGEALYMQLTGHRIDAQRAHQIGLIQEVVQDRKELFATAERIAAEIVLCAPLAVRAIKQIVYQGRDLPVEDSQRLGAALGAQVQATEDAREGPRAFAEKRTPVWKMR